MVFSDITHGMHQRKCGSLEQPACSSRWASGTFSSINITEMEGQPFLNQFGEFTKLIKKYHFKWWNPYLHTISAPNICPRLGPASPSFSGSGSATVSCTEPRGDTWYRRLHLISVYGSKLSNPPNNKMMESLNWKETVNFYPCPCIRICRICVQGMTQTYVLTQTWAVLTAVPGHWVWSNYSKCTNLKRRVIPLTHHS